MATYRIKMKTFAFAMTKANWGAAKNAFKAGNMGQAFKSGMGAMGRGTLGVAKGLAIGGIGAAGVGAVGAGIAGKKTLDTVTGEIGDNSTY